MTGKRRRGKDEPSPLRAPSTGGGGKRAAGKRRATDAPAASRPAARTAPPPSAPAPPPAPAPARSAAPTALPSRRSRRDARQQAQAERAQRRRRLGGAGIAGLVVIALIAAGAIAFGVHHVTTNGTPSVAPQTTLLLSVTGENGTAVDTALLAHDPSTHQGVELLLPGRVLTEVCGFGDQRLGDVLGLPDGVTLFRQAVTNLLGGVTIDGSWVLSTTQLASLVNAVGGVVVDVDVNVERPGPHGRRVVLLQQGPNQRLDGQRAVEFATYHAAGEDASANLVRLQSVIDGVLAALPTTRPGVEQVLSSLGAGAGSTIGTTRLTDFLLALSADARANAVLPTDLPVVKIDSGGTPSYRVDSQLTTDFVNQNLSRSLPPSARAPKKRVFVQNGVGKPGLVSTACKKLTAAGYAFAGSGNAPHFGFATSKVLVFDNSVATAQLGDDVAKSLGLPVTDVAVSPAGQNIADVIVILGKDYHP